MTRHKAIIAVVISTLGTILEWAEYTFFAYMADLLSTHFFPIEDPSLARLKTYGIFATSYFMRPIGALIFGSIGDRLGRKPALMFSMLLMGFATTTIGCLPTYTQLGSSAALLLILCRLLQGIAVSGEFHGAVTYLHEQASHRPFLMGSFGPFAAAAGMSLGALAAMLTTLSHHPHAWRIPFLCSGLLCILAMILRNSLKESPSFEKLKREQQGHEKTKGFEGIEEMEGIERITTLPKESHFKMRTTIYTPIITVFDENKLGLLKAMSMGFFISVYVYIGNIFFKILSMRVGGLTPILASEIVTFGQVSAAVLILFFGSKADVWGGKRMCLLGLKSAIVAGPFILYCAQSGHIYLTVLGQGIYAIINGLCSAPVMTLLLNKFKVQNRYSGSAFGWSLSAAIFGGTALLVAEWMVSISKWNWGPGCYISISAMVAYLLMGDKKEKIAPSIPAPSPLKSFALNID